MRALASTFEEDRWVPPPSRISGYRISQFMEKVGIDDLHELARWAAKHPEEFYPAVHEFLDVGWLRPWSQVRDETDGVALAKWFVGGGTNLAWLACERWLDATHPAIVWEGDDGETRSMSFG